MSKVAAMPDRFLRKEEIGAVFGTSPGVARTILLDHGVHPTDLGPGRGRGLRWLESAVHAVAVEMHRRAQPPPKTSKKPTLAATGASAGFLSRVTLDELYLLTHKTSVQ